MSVPLGDLGKVMNQFENQIFEFHLVSGSHEYCYSVALEEDYFSSGSISGRTAKRRATVLFVLFEWKIIQQCAGTVVQFGTLAEDKIDSLFSWNLGFYECGGNQASEYRLSDGDNILN